MVVAKIFVTIVHSHAVEIWHFAIACDTSLLIALFSISNGKIVNREYSSKHNTEHYQDLSGGWSTLFRMIQKERIKSVAQTPRPKWIYTFGVASPH